jgi:hypothetical protein
VQRKTAQAAWDAVIMFGHRVGDWRHCAKCGKVGLASRHTGRIHTWIERPKLVEQARAFNLRYAEGQAVTIKPPKHAWQRGYKAGRRVGKARPINPFTPGSPAAVAWLYGYLAGKAEVVSFSGQP